MKKLLSLSALFIALCVSAQQTANRFFYEISFKPKQDSVKRDKVVAILDIVEGKSIYQDYTLMAQDSIIKAGVEEMQRTNSFKDMSKMVTMPKFTYKIIKQYPEMKVTYNDRISMNMFGYEDTPTFNWSILPEKQKIGEYNAQKATASFGGREWTAWFSTDIPFQDGPYKFYGLPGLIVKVEDSEKEYSWQLSGNKTINDWKELSYSEEINAKMGMMSNDVKIITKDKFEKAYSNFKKDPMAEARNRIPANMLSMKMPGTDSTIGDFLKKQEKIVMDFFNSNNNPIEKSTVPAGTKK